jgi:DNA polymerase-1
VKKPLLVLFDGNAIIHRAFHALPPLTTSKTGEMVNAVYGFAQMLLKVISDLKPTHCAIAFDRAAPTFRHEMFADYKAQRPETPSELIKQFGRVRELVEAFGMPIFEINGYEADDILGTLSRQAKEQDLETIIVTGDADAMQLVSPGTKVLYPRPRGSFSETVLYDENEVVEKYGVKPSQITDLKGLKGDASDNIPGVSGIGEKTALKLIGQFGSIEQIYERLDEVSPGKLKDNLRQNETIARQSKTLATIVTDAPVSLDPDRCQVSHFDRDRVAALFRELEFTRLLDRMPSGVAPKTATTTEIIANPDALSELLARLSSAKRLTFDLETTGLDTMSARLVGISLAIDPGQAFYLPVGHLGDGEQLPLELVIQQLRTPLQDPTIAKVAHNAKYDMTVISRYGINVKNMAADTMLEAYLLGEKTLGLKALAFARLGIEMTPITDLIGTGAKQVTMAEVDISQAADYAGADADTTLRLAEVLEPELKTQGLWSLYSEVELPLVPVLMKMEANGISLDTARLGELSHELGEQLTRLADEIYQLAGHQFNINSPKQLATVLFQELKLPPTRRNKGAYTTGASELEMMASNHPIIKPILEYRQLAKLKSTYIDALPGLIKPQTGRLHTSFNQTKTTTGRLSSSEPNLQNIPVRGELGKQVRRAFIAPPGTYLLSGDYSQIDLRALAHLSGDENLIAAFHQDEDIHAATASRLFGVENKLVTPDMRRLAKTVNFGVIYGMSEYGLEQATELTREEAGKFISAYFDKYPDVKQYMEATKQQAREKGYVQTLLGRRRYIPDINASNRLVREAAERMATNMPVQGTSADIIKVAMINLDREMAKRDLKSRMLLQIHDELVFEVPEEELKLMRQLTREIMSQAVTAQRASQS